MKIDILTIWLVAFGICFVFQNFFTTQHSSWDVSYTYTSRSIDYIGFGQTNVSVRQHNTLTMGEVKVWLENHLSKGDKEAKVVVTILALKKTKTERFYYPFWRAIFDS